ncbi:integral peroxisomal membrane peroxin-domain-containing protein [Dichotomopilus funicola]|uniref:Integral peroxisomal membrane peroxin-domain-containing protein n=1 Tax=Dichotomopilus funicola TaxID=1934379 RepID=A0AAN6ZP37_9PEZI|nr:integral peroxisomal membrane peroxin-domain-containing protein [Dichotomopilus funicola]
MSTPRTHRGDSQQEPPSPSRHDATAAAALLAGKEAQSTYASFSPATLSATTPSATSAAKRRSTILVHQKSPLLLATPPQITRALAYSHPFLLPLNRLVGLLTWTTNDPWESFLLLAAFWAAVLYGDFVVRVAGPLVLVLVLIGGMYGRRFSPLSSSGWSEPGLGTGDGNAVATDGKNSKAARRTKNLSVDGATEKNGKAGKAGNGNEGAGGGARGHARNQSSLSEITNTRHQKTLDEIVETLREFTARCNILLEPLLELTDFLSTQRTPTSATTRPALTTLFVRILLCIPFWILLTLPPLRIITTRRVILILGTIFLSWHSRVIRVTRVILWRSATVRRVLGLVTGLTFETPTRSRTGVVAGDAGAVDKAKTPATSGNAKPAPRESELTKALRRARGRGTGVRFTFIIYENQRRWIGLGWTSSLFGYERPAWADEHNNAVPPRAEFELPEVEDGSNMRWQWAEGSRWRVDGVPDDAVMPGDKKEVEWDYDAPGGKMGWVYYDNKWQNGRRGQDGWNRWTRRRKWYRDAELVEADDDVADETHSQPADNHNHTEQQPKTPRCASAPIRTGARGLSPAPAVPTVDLTPSTPDLPLTPSSPPSTSTHSHSHHHPHSPSTSQQDDRDRDRDRDDDTTHTDSASILSTSSRSARFSLRRRITDSSQHRSIGSGAGGTSGSGQRSRRASMAASNASEDDAASLGPQARMAVQEAGGEAGSWGVGDEIRMGLE